MDNTGDSIIETKLVEAEKRSVGRPTDYPGDAAALKMIDLYYKECGKEDKLPSKAGLAVFFDVCKATIDNWERRYEEFLGALGKLHARQEDSLINRGLKSEYNSTICKLMLCSNHGYKERSDFTTGGEKITPQIVSYADAVQPKEQVKETPNGDNSS